MSQYLKKGATSKSPAFDLTLALEVLSPAQITADQNNYNPGTAGLWRLSSDATRTITGILAGSSGQLLTLVNVGSNPIILANLNGGSLAANQILTGTGADLTFTADQAINLEYDTTTSKWRILSTPGGGGTGGAGSKVFNYLTFS